MGVEEGVSVGICGARCVLVVVVGGREGGGNMELLLVR